MRLLAVLLAVTTACSSPWRASGPARYGVPYLAPGAHREWPASNREAGSRCGRPPEPC
ncbi:hypothetical protein NKH77_45945 [Streptomyces sp. M19]